MIWLKYMINLCGSWNFSTYKMHRVCHTHFTEGRQAGRMLVSKAIESTRQKIRPPVPCDSSPSGHQSALRVDHNIDVRSCLSSFYAHLNSVSNLDFYFRYWLHFLQEPSQSVLVAEAVLRCWWYQSEVEGLFPGSLLTSSPGLRTDHPNKDCWGRAWLEAGGNNLHLMELIQ